MYPKSSKAETLIEPHRAENNEQKKRIFPGNIDLKFEIPFGALMLQTASCQWERFLLPATPTVPPSGGRVKGYGSKINSDSAATLSSTAMRTMKFNLKEKKEKMGILMF